MSDIQFVDGLIVKKPHDNAPDFVKCAISIKRSELISWLTTKTDDWINLDVKESKAGKWYASVNDFKPSKQDVTAQQNDPTLHASGNRNQENPTYTHNEGQEDEFSDTIPF